MARTKGKMKAWRKMAEELNDIKSIEEGKSVKHQGRKSKRLMVEARPIASELVQNMLVRAADIGNLVFTFTKAQQKQIAESYAKLAAEQEAAKNSEVTEVTQ